MRLHALSLALLLVAPLGCDSKSEDGAKKEDKKANKGEAKKGDKPEAKAAAKPDEGAKLPSETETLALDQGESKIPATIDVPKGCTTFNDDPTTIRVNYGEKRDAGKLFGLQIAKGNEFNTDLDDLEKGMLENKYGSTNKIIEKTDNMLHYTMQPEGGEATHKFQMVLDLGGEKWVCKQGNYGGYDEAAVKRQMDACKTLKAKG